LSHRPRRRRNEEIRGRRGQKGRGGKKGRGRGRGKRRVAKVFAKKNHAWVLSCKKKSKVYPIKLLSTSRKAHWAFFLEPQT
jgi:hypothetical protein